jgi:hypothetical protein
MRFGLFVIFNGRSAMARFEPGAGAKELRAEVFEKNSENIFSLKKVELIMVA